MKLITPKHGMRPFIVKRPLFMKHIFITDSCSDFLLLGEDSPCTQMEIGLPEAIMSLDTDA